VIFDLPNNLFALREIVRETKDDESKQVKRAERALKEFSNELIRSIDEANKEKVSILRVSILKDDEEGLLHG